MRLRSVFLSGFALFFIAGDHAGLGLQAAQAQQIGQGGVIRGSGQPYQRVQWRKPGMPMQHYGQPGLQVPAYAQMPLRGNVYPPVVATYPFVAPPPKATIAYQPMIPANPVTITEHQFSPHGQLRRRIHQHDPIPRDYRVVTHREVRYEEPRREAAYAAAAPSTEVSAQRCGPGGVETCFKPSNYEKRKAQIEARRERPQLAGGESQVAYNPNQTQAAAYDQVETEIIPEIRTRRVTEYVDVVKHVRAPDPVFQQPAYPAERGEMLYPHPVQPAPVATMQAPHIAYMPPMATPCTAPCDYNGQLRTQPQPPTQFKRTGPRPGEFIQFDPHLTELMLDKMEGPTSDIRILRDKKRRGELKANRLTIGGRAKLFGIAESTDVDSKFGLLSRFPDQADPGGEGRGLLIDQIGLNAVLHIGDWFTIVAQPQYSDTFFDNDDVEMRELYAVMGDPGFSPFYAAFGRKAIDFGEFNNFNPFTTNVNWHFFHAQTEDPLLEVGYDDGKFSLSASLINDARQLRVALSDNQDDYDNYAFKARARFDVGHGRALLSASYLYDSIYRNNITVPLNAGVPPFMNPNAVVEARNGLWDVAAVYVSPHFDLGAEYTRSESSWPATKYDGLTGDVLAGVTENRGLDALTLQSRVKWLLPNQGSMALSGVFSRGIFGPENTEFDEVSRHVLGLEWHMSPYLDLGTEYVFADGFQPFVDIQNASDSGVQSHALLLGGKVRF